MLIVLIVLIGISLLVLTHEAGHFLAAKFFNMKVDEFGFGFPPRIFAKKYGETEYSVNWLPFGGFVKIAGENEPVAGAVDTAAPPDADRPRYFSSQPIWKRLVVIVAGVVVNFVTGWLLLSAVLMVGTPQVLVITDVQPGSPAAEVGLARGDIFKNFGNSQQFIDFVNSHRGEQISLDILRGSKNMTITVTPRVHTGEHEGAVGVILADGGVPKEGFFAALRDGFKATFVIAWLTLQAFGSLLAGLFFHAQLAAGVVGPVGIVSVAQQTGQLGLIYLLQLISLIAVNLAIINLVPLPALDGGRVLFMVIEKIKGSPLSQKFEIRLIMATYALLAVLMIALTIRDVVALF